MTLILKDRVRESSSTTGTGAMTLAGAASGNQRFGDVMSIGDTCWYAISLPGSVFETGIGTYSALNTLTRTTVLESSNSNLAVNFGGGTKDVFIGLPASKSLVLDNIAVPTNNSRIAATPTSGFVRYGDLTLSQVLDFVASTRGDMIVRGATIWDRLAKGAQGTIFRSDGTDTGWGNIPILHVRDEKASGTIGQSLSQNTWNNKRALNTIKTNEITGASVTSDVITLPIGKYRLKGSATVAMGGGTVVARIRAKHRLRNTTDGTTAVVGMQSASEIAIYDSGSGYGGPFMHDISIRGDFTIAAPKTFELQTWANADDDGAIGGTAVTTGEVEVYADLVFEKIG